MSFVVNSSRSPKQIKLDKLTAWPVENDSDKAHWNKLIEEHHYLHDSTLCGPQIRYVVSLGNMAVALLSFSCAAWHLIDRDNWIGWNEEQRERRLGFIVQNSRFLILPGKEVRNLASRSLALCLNRLSGDWDVRYGHRVLIVETFTEKRYPGTSYKADNWHRIGITRGFSRDTAKFYRENNAPKTIWIKELEPGAREILRAPKLPDNLMQYEKDATPFRKSKALDCKQLRTLSDVMGAVPDPRRTAGRRYSLRGCLCVIALGFLVGCEGLSECAEVGSRLSAAQLRAVGFRPHGRERKLRAPCHNTLWRVMSMVDTIEFERLIGQWFDINIEGMPTAIALDGKTLCGSRDHKDHAQHVVSMVSHDMQHTPFFCRRQQTVKDMRARRRAT